MHKAAVCAVLIAALPLSAEATDYSCPEFIMTSWEVHSEHKDWEVLRYHDDKIIGKNIFSHPVFLQGDPQDKALLKLDSRVEKIPIGEVQQDDGMHTMYEYQTTYLIGGTADIYIGCTYPQTTAALFRSVAEGKSVSSCMVTTRDTQPGFNQISCQ